MDFLKKFLPLVLMSAISVNCSSAINMTIEEGFQPYQIIGNIKSGLPIDKRQSQLTFSVDSPFINIKSNGDVTLKKEIDLETFCQISKLCCGQHQCVVENNILVSDQNDFIGPLTLYLKIIDKNDNPPRFPNERQLISISESSPINYTAPIEPAVDIDFSIENRIISYTLDDTSNTFLLDVSKLPQIALKLIKDLDYEKKQQFNFNLKACDRQTCAEKELVIQVTDENDNKPQFNQEVYRKSVMESVETGSLILTVKATDADSGNRGKVVYSIDATLDPDLTQTFGIEPRQGQIRLERRLAANVRRFYSFYVVAQDSDPIIPQKDKALVEIDVVDVNNYDPTISILGSEKIEVQENSDPGHLCTIKVVDYDIGNNSKVSCELALESRRDFKFQQTSDKLFSLLSIRRFDFESGQLKSANIRCQDAGLPVRTSSRVVLVHVLDVNEFKPVFEQPTYEVNIKENTESNKPFLRIQATDRDGSAVIRYSMESKGTKYFRIDPVTGWIRTTNTYLDRESMETIVFDAYATDALVDPFTTQTKVIVTVEDVNDNAPVFGVIPKFSIAENKISTRLQGQLTATDADKGMHAKVEFVLLKTWARKQEVKRIFHVSEDGHVETLQALDRETFDNYVLEVGVRDQAEYPLATSINITVTVLDENDNYPQWLFPNPLNPIYNMSQHPKVNDVVLTIKAFDTDDGENARIVYKLINSNTDGKEEMFQLKENGDLILKRDFDVEQVTVSLIASDCGAKPLTSTLKLTLNSSNRSHQSPSVSVIIILISVTGFISIILVVSIICVRKRPLGADIKYSCPTTFDMSKNNIAEWNFQDNSIYKQKPPVQLRSDLQMPLHNVASSRTSYEPIDAEESGDSGKGPSEDIRNANVYIDQSQMFARNYSSMQWKIPSPIPSSVCNGRPMYTIPGQIIPQKSLSYMSSPYPSVLMSNPENSILRSPSNSNPGGYVGISSPNTEQFSLPRSPDYYQSSNPTSQVYDTPECFNSDLDVSQMQQSNI